jgi:hypothetical protein
MEVESGDHLQPFAGIEPVRCLSCGNSYVKPTLGGTVAANPGCPDCGYVGWAREGSPVMEAVSPLRSVGDRLRRRSD